MIQFTPTAENYKNYHGQIVLLGRSKVKVGKIYRHSRLGSYERGLKFTDTEWAKLTRVSDRKISMDHGKTWHVLEKDAMRSKGKIKLKSNTTKEFAFEGIQEINRRYEGPSYRWYP